MIIDLAAEVTKLGVDCPLGWPDDFVAFVNAHRIGDVVAPQDLAGKDWRRRLAYRATDRAVREATGLTPLSVTADRIGLTAMRGAGLLARLAKAGQPVDRAGGGVVVEVYPAASLHQWRLPHKAYKGRDNSPTRERLLQQPAGPQLGNRSAFPPTRCSWSRLGERAGSPCPTNPWPRWSERAAAFSAASDGSEAQRRRQRSEYERASREARTDRSASASPAAATAVRSRPATTCSWRGHPRCPTGAWRWCRPSGDRRHLSQDIGDIRRS
ncbi:MAG: DUF429 domain-containing protein [Actinomycetota bacterium]|nr:DUF429 domain-containing protein [Actinomycetota bacterium]